MFNSLGEKISMLRKEAGLTQAQMAERIEMSRPSIVRIENSQRVISLEEGDAISKVLGISLDSLLTEVNNKSDKKSFAKAFKAMGMTDKNLAEIIKFELLLDALITQEQIYRG